MRQSDDVIRYLKRNEYDNLNAVNYLSYNKDADIYLYNGDIENGVIIGSAEQDPFFIDTINKDFLNEFWALLPRGHKTFSGVPKHIADVFRAGKEILWQSPCKTYVYNNSGVKLMQSGKYKDESLTVFDAEEVDKYYTYRDEGSVNMLRESIERADSSCIRIVGVLAAWCMVHAEDGSMGPIYTKEEYRRQGLAEILACRVIGKLIAKKAIPYVQIVDGNHFPLNLADKLEGMEYSHDCVWFGIVK